MNKTIKDNPLFLFALGSGAIGCILHLFLLRTQTDAGFFEINHPLGILLLSLCGITLVALLASALRLKGTPSYGHMFPTDSGNAIGYFCAAVGTLLVAVSTFFSLQGIIDIICLLLGLASTGCFIWMGVNLLRKKPIKHNLYMVVSAYFIFYLISQYRTWNNETQLYNYVFRLMGSVFLMFTAYYRACLYGGKNARRPYAFFHCGALLFCAICSIGQSSMFYLMMLMWLVLDWFSLSPKKASVPMPLPKQVRYCIEKLESAGHSAYVVGGCVRDFLLGNNPNDYDLCTDAKPEQIADIFHAHTLIRSGEKHGTIGVVVDHTVYEITTFRTEGEYTDSRHPDWVNFVSDIEEDLARRDFTVNAMAYSPTSGYIDPWGGQEDLQNKILRAVGDPVVRFSEDPLRILRGVRFAATYKLEPDEATEEAMLSRAHLMDSLSRERVFHELCRLLPAISAEMLIRFAPLIAQIIPELAPTIGFQQHSPHHQYDVFTHTAYTVAAVPPTLPLRLAALLHDVGKPATFTTDETGRGHFYNHAQVSGQLANEILLRLKAPNNLRSQVVFLVSRHMTFLDPDKKVLRRRLGQCSENMLLMLLDLQEADFFSKGVPEEATEHFSLIRSMIAEIREEDACLTVRNLAINGHDLMDLGFPPGPHIGECMNFLLSLVQDEVIKNEKEELLSAAKNFFNC